MKANYLLMALLILTVGCNGGGGGGGGSGATSEDSHLGIWSVCENYDGNSDTVNDSSILYVLSIGADSGTFNSTNYKAINCVGGNEGYRFVSTASFSRSGNVYSTVLKSDSYVSLSAEDVSWDNTNSWCGLSNWVINVPRNTLGLNCDGEVSNYGDTDTLTAVRTGNSLTVDDRTYALAIGTDFTPAGLTLPNGSYAFSDGSTFAFFAVINSGNYSVHWYDLASRFYSIETGTYTSSNNVVNFSVTGSSPVGCNSGAVSRRFTTGSLGITMEFVDTDLIIFAQKVINSESNFRSEFLGGGFSLACF